MLCEAKSNGEMLNGEKSGAFGLDINIYNYMAKQLCKIIGQSIKVCHSILICERQIEYNNIFRRFTAFFGVLGQLSRPLNYQSLSF